MNITENNKQLDNLKDSSKSILKIVKGSLIAIIISAILLTVYAAILAYTNISENTIIPVLFTITGISILIGSFMSSKTIRKQGILNGGLIGGIYVIVLYLISSLFTGNFSLDINSILMIVIGVISGMIGGIVGVNLK